VIHHTPRDPYPPSASIRETLTTRPLIVETYSTRRALLSSKRQYHWRVRHKSNGEVVASGEGYAAARDRDHIVDVLWPDLVVDPLG
jgi:hypothetical protein